MQDDSDHQQPAFSFADVDLVRQKLIDGYAEALLPFLLPAVRARAEATNQDGYVPAHANIAWILAHPGFRVIAAFNCGENEQKRVREEIEASRLVDGTWHMPLGEKKTVQQVFDGMCVSIALAIGCAWAEAVYYEVERVQGDEGRHTLLPSDIGDDMLPAHGEVFHAVIASGEIDLQAALDVLRESKKLLPEGERLPRALADDFIAGFD